MIPIFDLVLQIDADLPQMRTLPRRYPRNTRCAIVDRVIDIEQRGRATALRTQLVVVVIIQSRQHRMFPITGLKVTLQLVIHAKHVDFAHI